MQLLFTAIVVLFALAILVVGVFAIVAFAFGLGKEPVLAPDHCSQAAPAIPPTPKERTFTPVPEVPKDKSALQDQSDLAGDRTKKILRKIEENEGKTDLELQIIK